MATAAPVLNLTAERRSDRLRLTVADNSDACPAPPRGRCRAFDGGRHFDAIVSWGTSLALTRRGGHKTWPWEPFLRWHRGDHAYRVAALSWRRRYRLRWSR